MSKILRLPAMLLAIAMTGCAGDQLINSTSESLAAIEPAGSPHRSSTSRRRPVSLRDLKQQLAMLRPLHQKLSKPQPGDWLDRHKEPGQTFAQYLRQSPVTPTGKRSVLYIQPLGPFSTDERKVVGQTAEFMGFYLNCKVRVREDLPLEVIPEKARRVHPQWKVPQILTGYVLHDLLKPQLPDDAAACLALTTIDLWPGRNWNFVFGQASLRNRVGVWSLARNGNLENGDDERIQFLRRTLRTATHETGHMFSIKHCTAFECNMNGSNSLDESDRHPLYLCPECHAKVCWATRADPMKRLKALADFCRKHELKPELAYYEKAIATLTTSE